MKKIMKIKFLGITTLVALIAFVSLSWEAGMPEIVEMVKINGGAFTILN